MGHVVNIDREHQLLRQQMDRHVTGAPDSPAILQILAMLYTSEEARLVRQIPIQPVRLESLARKLGEPADSLCDRLQDLARRGLVFDFERKGERWYMLPPILGGIYEFVMMRPREDLPMEELSRLFDEYLNGDEGFVRAAYGGDTQFARALIREEALPEGDPSEILDWERVTRLVEQASMVSVALCPCRHKNSHLNTACDRPQRTCISLNTGAEAMVYSGISERIDAREALRLIDECKAAGLMQVGDNVQRRNTFICNCCGCCCTLMHGMRALDIRHAVVSTNWIAELSTAQCTGCGRCVRACPVRALTLTDDAQADSTGKRAALDADLCLGCGVCATTCPSGAIRMKARPSRVFTPESTFDMVSHMAIERGKVADLLFENPERISHRAIARLLRTIERSAPWKAAMAVRPLRSSFLNTLVRFSKDAREARIDG